MFKVEWKDHNGKWRKMISGRSYSTEAAAWVSVGLMDQDGIIDKHLYRVMPVR